MCFVRVVARTQVHLPQVTNKRGYSIKSTRQNLNDDNNDDKVVENLILLF